MITAASHSPKESKKKIWPVLTRTLERGDPGKPLVTERLNPAEPALIKSHGCAPGFHRPKDVTSLFSGLR